MFVYKHSNLSALILETFDSSYRQPGDRQSTLFTITCRYSTILLFDISLTYHGSRVEGSLMKCSLVKLAVLS